jgi:predicted enzyme related to lactoylglutathione lyase
MRDFKMRLAGVELYFDDLDKGKRFYRDTLGLNISEEETGRYAKFAAGEQFICLERKGTESYPSRDKAVVFIEVDDLGATMEKIGRERIVQLGPNEKNGQPSWAVLHDPEGYNVLLLQASNARLSRKQT